MAVFESPFLKASPRNRWANVLDGLSRGLAEIGKMHEARENDERKEKHEDARDAARRAMDENLARFHSGEENARLDKTIGAEGDREQKRLDTEKEIHAADEARRVAEHGDEVAYRNAELGISGAHLALDRDKSARDDARQGERDKRAESTDEKNRAATALHSTEAELTSYMKERDELNKEINNPLSKLDPKAAAEGADKLKALDAQISATRTDLRDLRKSAGFTSTADKTAAGADSAHLSPDRQQLYDDTLKAHPDTDPSMLLDTLKRAPQKQIDGMMSSRPTADTETGGATPSPSDFIAAPGDTTGGIKNSGALASANAPDVLNDAEPQGADMKATATDATGGGPQAQAPIPGTDPNAQVADMAGGDSAVPDPNAGGDTSEAPDGVETPSDQMDQSAQYSQMQQQLAQSPEGQGLHATLDRLATSENPVQQDKLRRQAEFQVQDAMPDQDANGYIDWYLEQQQQQPEFT
jgi:hypothetical protein